MPTPTSGQSRRRTPILLCNRPGPYHSNVRRVRRHDHVPFLCLWRNSDCEQSYSCRYPKSRPVTLYQSLLRFLARCNRMDVLPNQWGTVQPSGGYIPDYLSIELRTILIASLRSLLAWSSVGHCHVFGGYFCSQFR